MVQFYGVQDREPGLYDHGAEAAIIPNLGTRGQRDAAVID